MTDVIADKAFLTTLESLGEATFSTKEFVDKLKIKYPDRWSQIENEYGRGGKGAGTHYSANSFASQVLNGLWKGGKLQKLDYRPSPPGWGSRRIRVWSQSKNATLFPDEAGIQQENEEGTSKKVLVNKYERDPTARLKCIERYGLTCRACRTDFEKIYGPRGAGFIHIHHLIPISRRGGVYKLNPIRDLCPVCPNCHAMIHYKEPMLTIDQVRSLLEKNSS